MRESAGSHPPNSSNWPDSLSNTIEPADARGRLARPSRGQRRPGSVNEFPGQGTLAAGQQPPKENDRRQGWVVRQTSKASTLGGRGRAQITPRSRLESPGRVRRDDAGRSRGGSTPVEHYVPIDYVERDSSPETSRRVGTRVKLGPNSVREFPTVVEWTQPSLAAEHQEVSIGSVPDGRCVRSMRRATRNPGTDIHPF